MRSAILTLGVILSFGTAEALAEEQESLDLAIWNDSSDDIVVVVETPSANGASQRKVAVPSRSVVHNIPLPNVKDDQFAIAYKAHKTADALKRDSPARVVGFQRIFPRPSPYHASRHVNSTIPVLRYQSYDPPEAGDVQYGGKTGVLSEMSAQMHSLSAPVYTADARDLVNEAMMSAQPIDYERVQPQS